MEQVGAKVVANDLAGNPELHGKGCDFLLNLEGHNILAPPIMCASLTSDWPEGSTSGCMDMGRTEDKDLSRHVVSLGGSEAPPHAISPFSITETGNVIEELVTGDHRISNLDLVRSPDGDRRTEWNLKSKLPSEPTSEASNGSYMFEGKDKMLLRVGEQLKKFHLDWLRSKHLPVKRTDHDTKETSAHLIDSEKMILSSNMLSNGGAPLKNFSNFPQPLAKNSLKRKGAVCRNQEDLTGIDGMGQFDEKLGYARKIASAALIRSCTKNDQISLHRIDRSGLESLNHGINLREYLKPGGHRRDKVESLLLFRQIVELVDLQHSQGVPLQDLRPSCFKLLSSNRIVYTGLSMKQESGVGRFNDLAKKRLLEQDVNAHSRLVTKQQKLSEDMKYLRQQSRFISRGSFMSKAADEIDTYVIHPTDSDCVELQSQNGYNFQSSYVTKRQPSTSFPAEVEEKWYRSPEQLNENHSTFSSNIYALGVLLFELLSWFESCEGHSAMMLDLHCRILPPNFLSENPKEAGFCFWLLHPEPSSRPTTREILQSDLICQSQELSCGSDAPISPENDDSESELLLEFLFLLENQNKKHVSKLLEDIECLEEDIKEVEKRYLLRKSTVFSQTQDKFSETREHPLHFGLSSDVISRSSPVLEMNEVCLMKNINKIEDVYFSMRSQISLTSSAARSDTDLLKNRGWWSAVNTENEQSNMNQKSVDHLGVFFEGLCKFARYNKFEVHGSIKNGDILGSTNVVCSLSFDRDEDFIAAAGVSKKIKIYEFESLLDDSMDIHYPAVEMSNKSKFSCVGWNNYIKNYLASTDYDGVVQMWDASTGQAFSQYIEHQKRAWSVDFSIADPLVFASGSDDCSVKLWRINERRSIGTIWNPANICCVQFSSFSSHFLVFGSADYKVYCYDLRHTKIPWCTLAGHGKAVSYVKFLDSETLISASTDNTLKLWDLKKTSSTGLSSSACSRTFGGHTNEKNFVGLSALDGYIACGSETNEVYCYHKSLPMPITSHKFGYVDPISGKETGDDSGQFVSSVCWRQRSKMVVAANSSGNMKLLQLV